jgi:hypothetical protein
MKPWELLALRVVLALGAVCAGWALVRWFFGPRVEGP